MSIRLICLDLDGTTLRRDGTVSARTLAALRRAMAAGATVAIATGRIHGSAAPHARRIGINGPVISSNGAMIRELDGSIRLHRPLPRSVVAAAVEVGAATGVQMDLFAADALYTTDVARKLRAWRQWQWQHANSLAGLWSFISRPRPPYAVRHVTQCAGLVDKLFISTGDPTRLQQACDLLARAVPEPLTVCSSGSDNLELTAGGVSKGSAVLWLAAQMGATLDQVMVAGDSLNDLSMFELDCFKVAMGNAEAVIKEKASFVTASHHDDGVAAAVERFVLGEAAI